MLPGSITGVPLNEAVRSLGQTLDTDRDGRLSDKEFRSLLSRALGEVTHPRRDLGLASPRSASGVVLDGYDVAKLADPGVTLVKYRFGRVAQHYDLSMVRDGASAEALSNDMTADLETAGLTVLGVRQDEIRVRTTRGRPPGSGLFDRACTEPLPSSGTTREWTSGL